MNRVFGVGLLAVWFLSASLASAQSSVRVTYYEPAPVYYTAAPVYPAPPPTAVYYAPSPATVYYGPAAVPIATTRYRPVLGGSITRVRYLQPPVTYSAPAPVVYCPAY